MDYINAAREMINSLYENEVDYLSFLRNKHSAYKYICIFGVGNIGRPTAREMKTHNLQVDYYCDNDSDKQGKYFDGIKCLSVEELCQIKDETLVIICGRAYEDIYYQLKNIGMPYLSRLHVNKIRIRDYLHNMERAELIERWEKIFYLCSDAESKKVCFRILSEWCQDESNSLGDVCTDDQYFCDELISLSPDEVFVDGGAYIGDTLQQYTQFINSYKKYYCFELSKNNYVKLLKYVDSIEPPLHDRTVCINSGLSDRVSKVTYSDDDEGARLMEYDEGIEGYITTIDDACHGENVSYIKMDIEGSELAALKGSKNTITRCRPKLAICVYHKPQDMWEIPTYINELDNTYRIYFRHHTDLMNETVCYAL